MIDEATGFSENHYLIDGKNYHAYELTYAIPEERCAASTSRSAARAPTRVTVFPAGKRTHRPSGRSARSCEAS